MSKNLILITIDCLRADHLACNGYGKKISKNIDEIADEGVNFSQAISLSSWTAPSFAGMFTSTYPLMYNGYVSLTEQRLPFPEILSDEGYDCAGFTFFPYLDSIYNYDRGFDLYEGGEGDQISVEKGLVNFLREKLGREGTLHNILSNLTFFYKQLKLRYDIRFSYESQSGTRASKVNEAAKNWISNRGGGNFFLWLHYQDPHSPYLPPEEYLENSMDKWEVGDLHVKRNIVRKFDEPGIFTDSDREKLMSLYDSEINYLDGQIGDLIDFLEKNVDMENTCLVITADHGEEFLEHGGVHHELKLYEELIHVPLIIKDPSIQGGKTIQEPVSLIDFAPTIPDLLDINIPAQYIGRSFVPSLEDKNHQFSPCFSEEGQKFPGEGFWMEPGKIRLNPEHGIVSYRTDRWKYIYRKKGKDELYNLEKDSKEQKNVVFEQREIAENFKSKILDHLSEEESISSEREKLREKITDLRDREF